MEKQDEVKKNSSKGDKLSLFFIILASIVIVILAIYKFISPLQFVIVSGESMMPTLQDGQWHLLDTRDSAINNIKKGDIITVTTQNKRIIKRVVGMPGDELRLNYNDDETTLCLEQKINGEWVKINEPYINEPIIEENAQKIEGDENIAVIVKEITSDGKKYISYWKCGENEYVILGDNRNHSNDSRALGVIKKEEIYGKAIYFFPKKK